MTIGERIRKRRIELGLSQEELAKRLGNKSRASVCTVEKDKEDLTTDRIRKYAVALETTPAYLMGWEDEFEPDIGNNISPDVLIAYRDRISKMFLSNDNPDFSTMLMKYSKLPPDAQKTVNDLVDSMYNTYYLQKGDSNTNSELSEVVS